MTVKDLKEKKQEMEQRISVAMKEFEEATNIEISSIGFSRCIICNEFGIEKEYNYNVETGIKL